MVKGLGGGRLMDFGRYWSCFFPVADLFDGGWWRLYKKNTRGELPLVFGCDGAHFLRHLDVVYLFVLPSALLHEAKGWVSARAHVIHVTQGDLRMRSACVSVHMASRACYEAWEPSRKHNQSHLFFIYFCSLHPFTWKGMTAFRVVYPWSEAHQPSMVSCSPSRAWCVTVHVLCLTANKPYGKSKSCLWMKYIWRVPFIRQA